MSCAWRRRVGQSAAGTAGHAGAGAACGSSSMNAHSCLAREPPPCLPVWRGLTGHLQVDAAGHAAHLVVHIEEGLHLRPGQQSQRKVRAPHDTIGGAAGRHREQTPGTAGSRERAWQRPPHLGANVVVAPRLIAVDLLSVAVHRVAHPGNHLAGLQRGPTRGGGHPAGLSQGAAKLQGRDAARLGLAWTMQLDMPIVEVPPKAPPAVPTCCTASIS